MHARILALPACSLTPINPSPWSAHHPPGKGGFFNRLILGWTIVKFDPIKEEPVKDKYGRLIPCKGAYRGTRVTLVFCFLLL